MTCMALSRGTLRALTRDEHHRAAPGGWAFPVRLGDEETPQLVMELLTRIEKGEEELPAIPAFLAISASDDIARSKPKLVPASA